MTRLPDYQKMRLSLIIRSSGHPVIRSSIFLIRLYQWCVSPWLGACCRFSPSCSHYAVEAIEQHGLLKGSIFSARRLLRCHPFAHSGYDPVPPSKKSI